MSKTEKMQKRKENSQNKSKSKNIRIMKNFLYELIDTCYFI